MLLAVHEQNKTNRPAAPAVVFLHGVFGRGRNLGGLQRALADRYRTIALDLRSHGESPHGPISYDAMAADVAETLDALGLERVRLVGHSMGGKTAMRLALTRPDRVEKLLVADIAPAPMRHGQNVLAEALAGLTLPELNNRQEIRAFLTPLSGSAALADWLGQNIAPGAPARWTIGLEEITAAFETIEDWPTLPPGACWKGPALFLRGENSPYVQPALYPTIHALFPNARIEIVRQAGHWLHVEQSEAFIAAMERFLA